MQIRVESFAVALVLLFSVANNAIAQRVVVNDHDHVIYEDARHKQKDLGVGFSPILTTAGKVLMIRGIVPDYGTDFDCNDRNKKDWVAIYDPGTDAENTFFDTPVHYSSDYRDGWCIFDGVQLSPDGKVLYLVAPVYATSGELAIIRLADGETKNVPGVNLIYLIEDGPHRGDLIFSARRIHDVDGFTSPYYPYIHAHPDGQEIQIISDESLTVGKQAHAPILSAYLKRLGGHITVNVERFP